MPAFPATVVVGTHTVTVTLRMLDALRSEAARWGDLEQVAMCDLARAGNPDAIRDCAYAMDWPAAASGSGA